MFKENAIYGLQENLLDNFLRNFYIWSAIVNGACMQKLRFNFRCANFDSFSWRVCLSYGVCRLRPRVQLKTLSSQLSSLL